MERMKEEEVGRLHMAYSIVEEEEEEQQNHHIPFQCIAAVAKRLGIQGTGMEHIVAETLGPAAAAAVDEGDGGLCLPMQEAVLCLLVAAAVFAVEEEEEEQMNKRRKKGPL
ncbi:MAG TPA: hypothetical protein V6C97_27230 [Oculatellaceae cyanobacterium]